MNSICGLLVATIVFTGTALGQSIIGPPSPAAPLPTASPSCTSGTPGTLTVQGVGQSEAPADQAQVSLSISVLNGTAYGARIVAAGYADAVISAVKQIPGIFDDNVTTTSVSVQPKTTYNSNTGTSTTVGYTYTNRLSVAIGSLTGDLLSNVLDTAVRNGGNNLTISSVSFDLSPGLSYNKTVEARSQAVRDAQTTAQQYTQGFGVNLGALLSVTDRSTGVTPVQSNNDPLQRISTTTSTLAASSSSTPISIGKQSVTTQLLVSYTVCTPLS